MNAIQKPGLRPANPRFSSGPCAKRPGWSVEALSEAFVGRSHRHAIGKARLQEVIERSKRLLRIPEGYRLGIVPGSDTGAVEMAMWTLLGPRSVEVLQWESFGGQWASDVTKQLRLKDVKVTQAGYGQLPDLSNVDFSRDVIFTWNGTTSGVRVPNGDWIADDRQGLTICDATSAAFAMDIPWSKIDVATWSWQKAMGGEAAHGMLLLSPRAVERIAAYDPPWPMPKVFRIKKGGKLNEEIFEGSTINTPSLLCVEDALDGLRWGDEVGGLDGLIGRAERNAAVLSRWSERSDWIANICSDAAARSTTSVGFIVTDAWFKGLAEDAQRVAIKKMCGMLDKEGVAHDLAAHRDAPPGLRIWCGATVETSDLEALCPWLDWAFAAVKSEAGV